MHPPSAVVRSTAGALTLVNFCLSASIIANVVRNDTVHCGHRHGLRARGAGDEIISNFDRPTVLVNPPADPAFIHPTGAVVFGTLSAMRIVFWLFSIGVGADCHCSVLIIP
jgi:hypothetical protein